MPRSISTEKGETRNTHFRGENIRESQVSVIQAMSGLESKTEVIEERLHNIILTLKYKMLSDVRDEDKVQVFCCVGKGWGGPEGVMGREKDWEGGKVGQWIRKGRWELEGRRVMVENTGLMN